MKLQEYLEEIRPNYSGYQELHTHSIGSYRDAVNSVEDIFDAAEVLGRNAASITDHGNMTRLFAGLKERTKREKKALRAELESAGADVADVTAVLDSIGTFDSIRNPTESMYQWIEKYGDCFVRAVKKTVQFVPGIEMYATDGPWDNKARHHIILFATDWIGMQQLFKLCNVAQTNQYKKMPQITFESLSRFAGPGTPGHGKIIATSACVGGHLNKILLRPQALKKKIDALEAKYASIEKVDVQKITAMKQLLACQEESLKNARTQKNESKSAAGKKVKSRLDRVQKKLLELTEKQNDTSLSEDATQKLTDSIRETEQRYRQIMDEYAENQKLAALLPEREKRVADLSTEIKTLRTEIQDLEKKAAPQIRIRQNIEALEKQLSELGDVYATAKQTALQYDSILGRGNYYIELQNHGIPDELYCAPLLRRISAETGIPLTVANDVHYKTVADKHKRDILASTYWGKPIEEIASMDGNDQLYFKSNEEMEALFSDVPEAIQNTSVIAARCNVFYKKEMHLPAFDTQSDMTPNEYLREKALQNIKAKYPDYDKQTQEWKDNLHRRLDYELDVIEKMGYSSYHAIVQDYIQYGRSLNGPELVGPGRGSAAGSLACYLLDITNVDPLRYDLIFERFLNPARVSMPDIDTDFAMSIRDKVVEYVSKRYAYKGEYPEEIRNTVCGISAEGTLGGRGAVRSVGRVLSIPYDIVDRTAKMIPSTAGMTIQKAMDENADLQALYASDEIVRQLIDDALLVEGLPDHSTVHAAGVIIADKPVSEYAPMFWNEAKSMWVIQYDMTSCEADVGLLKMDFLSLRNLDIIGKTKELVGKDKASGKELNFDELRKADDPKVIHDIFAEGNTIGVFQFESGGMQKMLANFAPQTIDDVALLNAAYRPGPMQYIPSIINVKFGKEKPVYIVPEMKEILGPTYGKPVFQEQIQQIFHQIAGFSLGEADIIRRAMSKKHLDELVQYKDAFMDGFVRRGATQKATEAFWNELLEFAKYAFNKSHAVAYSITAYYTAFLKLYYPAQYAAALMTYFPDKIPLFVREFKRRGITLLCPNVNSSESEFSVTADGNVLFGLKLIKGVASAADTIIQERKRNGKYTGYKDFIIRMVLCGVNRGVINNLILSGCLDSFVRNRKEKSDNLEAYLESCRSTVKRIKGRTNAPSSNKELYETVLNEWVSPVFPPATNFTRSAALEFEKELLGFYATGHPLDEYAEKLEADGIENIVSLDEDEETIIAGQIQSLQMLNRRSDGKKMCKFVLEDLSSEIEVVCFTKVYERCQGFIKEGAVVSIKGRSDFEIGEKDGENVVLNRQFIAQEVSNIGANNKMVVTAPIQKFIDTIQPILAACARGSTTVYLNDLVSNEVRKTIYNVCVSEALTETLTKSGIDFAF